MGRGNIPKEFRESAAYEVFERVGGIRVERSEGTLYRNGKSARMPRGRTVQWTYRPMDVDGQYGQNPRRTGAKAARSGDEAGMTYLPFSTRRLLRCALDDGR